MLNPTYLPTLRDLIPVDDLPDSLGFLQAPLGTVLDKLFYDNLTASRSDRGETAFYNLDVILMRKIVLLEIPGTEIALILNPPDVQGNQSGSSFNVTFEYHWEILRFINGAKLSTFSFDVRGFIDLLSNIFGIAPEEMTEEVINVFVGDLLNPQQGQDPLQDFVDAYNLKYTPQITSFLDLPDVVQQISANHDLLQLIIDDYLDNAFEKLKFLITKWVGPLDEAGLKRLIIPKFLATLNDVSLGIELPRSVFIPVDNNNAQLPGNAMIRVAAGAFGVDSEKGFIFDKELTFSFTRSEILNTGFILDINGLKLDFSEKVNIPEADADGRPADFRGVYIQDATIDFPAFWQHDDNASTGRINMRNLLAGTGGISGTIGLEAKSGNNPTPLIEAKFGSGFSVRLDAFRLKLHQNTIVESEITGLMKIPGFKDAGGINDAEIRVKAHIGQHGDFSVTASEADGIRIGIAGIFDFIIRSASVGRVGGRFYLEVAGALDFKDMGGTIGQFLPDQIEIQKLVIWDDGQIELKGGKLTLPRAVTLKVGPVTLSVSAIGLGSHEQMHPNTLSSQPELRQYKYFTFDGGIDTGPGGVDVSGNGVAFYYTTDDDPQNGKERHFFMRIQSIAIDIVIPGDAKPEHAALLLKGYLSMKNPENGGEGTEYAGGIDFTLPKLKMGGSAAMRLNPNVPAFVVDIGLEMSTPILLGATGLGIYGFRALVGQRYVASKAAAGVGEDTEWWQYYKARVADGYKEGIQVEKFSQEDGFSLGAGISLATAYDAGKTFSSKLFFLLSLPNVFLMQGQAAILKQRIGLDDTPDPPFFALIAITSTSVEAGLGASYKIPDDGANPGKIATIDGVIEMGFFFGNASSWYVNIGRETPENRRIQARLLNLFNSYFYMMISSSGIRAGAGSSFEVHKEFGPLKADLSAYLDIQGKLSFKPKQIGGAIQLGGSVALSAFGLGFSLSARTSLAAEAPKPFTVTGDLEVCVMILRKERCAHFSFSWVYDNDLDTSEIALLNPDLTQVGKASTVVTRENFPVLTTAGNAWPNPNTLEDYVIPMDSYIDIEFLKGVLPAQVVRDSFGGNTMGSNYIDFVAPQRGRHDRVRHAYSLDSVQIKYWDPLSSSWEDYDMYQAATPLQVSPFVTTNLNDLKDGYWQYQQPNLHNKLRIMAQSPLSFVSQGSGDIIPEDLGITTQTIFCTPAAENNICLEFASFFRDDMGIDGTGRPIVLSNQLIAFGELVFRIVGATGYISPVAFGGFQQGLRIAEGSQLEIFFFPSTGLVEITLLALCDTAVVSFYAKSQTGTDGSGLPIYSDVLVSETTFNLGDGGIIAYHDLSLPVDKVVVSPIGCGKLGGGKKDPKGGAGGKGDPGGSSAVMGLGLDPNGDGISDPLDCAAYVYLVCYQEWTAAVYNATLPTASQVQAENNSMIAGFSGSIHPIWRPDTHYAIRIETTDTLQSENGANNLVAPYQRTHILGFKTAGPMGHFHQYYDATNTQVLRDDYNTLLSADREDEFKLSHLRHYLDFPKCFPNADGQLINAKPLYFVDPKLNLYYLQAYVYAMYGDWDAYGGKEKVYSSIEVLVKDPAPNPALSAIAPVGAAWQNDQVPIVSQEVTLLNNMIQNGGPCSTVTTITPIGIHSQFALPSLEPLKLYTAVFNARYKRDSDLDFVVREVHRYGFQTSRYSDFKAHINSYKLLTDQGNTVLKAAIFDVVKVFDAGSQIAVATAILTGTMAIDHPLVQTFADPYNRLLEGALKMEALAPAETTEFNLIRDSNTGNVLGLLVRSPEPFNDPKMPPAALADTVYVSIAGGPNTDYRCIFSKDNANVLITNDNGSLSIPLNSNVELKWVYKLWDGQAYTAVDSEIVTFDILPL